MTKTKCYMKKNENFKRKIKKIEKFLSSKLHIVNLKKRNKNQKN